MGKKFPIVCLQKNVKDLNMETRVKKNDCIRIIRMVVKGNIEITFTVKLQTREFRSHYHNRQLRIFSPNRIEEGRTGEAA
jgi:hypothetical protein